jgi:hypothetical protein
VDICFNHGPHFEFLILHSYSRHCPPSTVGKCSVHCDKAPYNLPEFNRIFGGTCCPSLKCRRVCEGRSEPEANSNYRLSLTVAGWTVITSVLCWSREKLSGTVQRVKQRQISEVLFMCKVTESIRIGTTPELAKTDTLA